MRKTWWQSHSSEGSYFFLWNDNFILCCCRYFQRMSLMVDFHTSQSEFSACDFKLSNCFSVIVNVWLIATRIVKTSVKTVITFMRFACWAKNGCKSWLRSVRSSRVWTLDTLFCGFHLEYVQWLRWQKIWRNSWVIPPHLVADDNMDPRQPAHPPDLPCTERFGEDGPL